MSSLWKVELFIAYIYFNGKDECINKRGKRHKDKSQIQVLSKVTKQYSRAQVIMRKTYQHTKERKVKPAL